MIKFGSTRKYRIGECVRVPDRGMVKVVYVKPNHGMYRYYGFCI